MEPVHVTLAGAILAVIFALSISAVLLWMLRLPEQTPATLQIAKAVRQAQHANRILVPVQGLALSDRMVALGAQMAKARQAQVEVFYVVEVPRTLPLDARLPDAERHAAEVLDRARRIAQRYGVPLETRVANAREAGRAIVDEATATGADIILMGDIPERPGETKFNATTTFVFSHAPSEVIIDRPSLESLTRQPAPSDRTAEVVGRGR
ncbi:MAG TPA: universal stress protein [Chloroflexota bacterium]|nr:universal stress protein [Chloroflexota bacterium]